MPDPPQLAITRQNTSDPTRSTLKLPLELVRRVAQSLRDDQSYKALCALQRCNRGWYMLVCPLIYEDIRGSKETFTKLFELFGHIDKKERYLVLGTIFDDPRHPVEWSYSIRLAWMLSQIKSVGFTPKLETTESDNNLVRALKSAQWVRDCSIFLDCRPSETVFPNARKVILDARSFASTFPTGFPLESDVTLYEKESTANSLRARVVHSEMLAHFRMIGIHDPTRKDLRDAINRLPRLFDGIIAFLPCIQICIDGGRYQEEIRRSGLRIVSHRGRPAEIVIHGGYWAVEDFLSHGVSNLVHVADDPSDAGHQRRRIVMRYNPSHHIDIPFKKAWVVRPPGDTENFEKMMDSTITMLNQKREDKGRRPNIKWGYLPTEFDGTTKCPCCGSE